MKWILLAVICLGLVTYFARKYSPSKKGIQVRQRKRLDNQEQGKTYVSRVGETVEADEAFFAWSSGNLEQMLRATEVKTNPIDRHFLLQSIVETTYKNRSDSKQREICKETAEKHISEFGDIAPALKKDIGIMPRVSTFQHYATVLTEDGEYDRAIEVCKVALSYGLHDGTKTGFEGRIERIDKERQKGSR